MDFPGCRTTGQFHWGFGEPGRIRTFDRLIKSQMLCQLSYGLSLGANQTGCSGTVCLLPSELKEGQYPGQYGRPACRV